MRHRITIPTDMNRTPKYRAKKLDKLISTSVQLTISQTIIPKKTPTIADAVPLHIISLVKLISRGKEEPRRGAPRLVDNLILSPPGNIVK